MGETYQPFVMIEAAYMAWFTLEFFVRLLSSPSKVGPTQGLISRRQMEFIKKLMNIVDLLAILPYYISLAFYRWSRGRLAAQLGPGRPPPGRPGAGTQRPRGGQVRCTISSLRRPALVHPSPS
jgi:hypothetical protein